MTTPRRVVALESSLDPREFVFHVIAEAREYANLEAYARSLVDVPVEAAPLSRLGAHAETSVRARMKGQPREKVDAAVRRAVGDAVFRYVLFLRLNTSALEMSEREGLRAAATVLLDGLPPQRPTRGRSSTRGMDRPPGRTGGGMAVLALGARQHPRRLTRRGRGA